MKRQLTTGALALLTLGVAGCPSSDSDTPDAAVYGNQDAPVLSGNKDAAVSPDLAVADPFVWVVIQDTEQKACTTNGPGADIDGIALISGVDATTILGYGANANYKANPQGVACENVDCNGGNCKYSYISKTLDPTLLLSYTIGEPDAVVSATADDVGYFSLNAGTLQMEIADVATGINRVSINSGDWISVYEVDKSYITSGNAPATCACVPEHYTVYVQTISGVTKTLTPQVLNPDNKECTASAIDGCGSTVFLVP
jgi:hypothetical protein